MFSVPLLLSSVQMVVHGFWATRRAYSMHVARKTFKGRSVRTMHFVEVAHHELRRLGAYEMALSMSLFKLQS